MQEYCNFVQKNKRTPKQYQEIFSEVAEKILAVGAHPAQKTAPESEETLLDIGGIERLAGRFGLFMEQDDKKVLHKPRNLDLLLNILVCEPLVSATKLRKAVTD
jgi:hypothetical protein